MVEVWLGYFAKMYCNCKDDPSRHLEYWSEAGVQTGVETGVRTGAKIGVETGVKTGFEAGYEAESE